jgi:TctA family transporter
LSLEHPDRPATTIAAPPMATTNPRFTNVLLCVGVIRQDRRIIPSSMVGHPDADTRLAEKCIRRKYSQDLGSRAVCGA